MTAPHSLRLRLLVGGAVWIAVALLASWMFIAGTFNAIIEQERRSDLQVSLDQIVGLIEPEATPPLTQGTIDDPRYATPLGGVYWQVRDLESGELARSRSSWDVELPVAGAVGDRPSLFQYTPPDGLPLIVLSQTVRIAGADGAEHRYAVAVAEARVSEDDPNATFGRALAIFLAILAIALFLAAYAQVAIGLRPLGQLGRQVAAVRDGAATRLPPASSIELTPLVQQVNDLLDAQEASMDFTRQRAADLAHGLKTPLSVLSATADRLQGQGDNKNAPILRMLTDQMNERIDYQLRIARLRFRTRALGVHASLSNTVLRSVAVLRKAPAGEHLNWVVDIGQDLEVNMDGHDLMELVGIVLENAQQWAGGQVRVRGSHVADAVELLVEDDGKGLSDEQIARLGTRGVRLDEASGGDGLGLAIATEIIRLNRADMVLSRSDLGGLEVRVRFPVATEAGAP